MAFLTNALERAYAALDSAKRRLADFETERAAKSAALTGNLDFDGSLALRDEIAVLEPKIAAAKDAIDQARGNVEAAQKAEAEAETEREYRAAEKSARAAEKLTLEVAAAAEKLADMLVDLEASRTQVEVANANRGTRPFIKDGEFRVREVPEKIQPAVYEDVTVWEDGAGNRPYQFRQLPNGDLVPAVGGYTSRKEKVVSRAEQVTPAHLPGGRFNDAMRVIGLKGEPLFPTR